MTNDIHAAINSLIAAARQADLDGQALCDAAEKASKAIASHMEYGTVAPGGVYGVCAGAGELRIGYWDNGDSVSESPGHALAFAQAIEEGLLTAWAEAIRQQTARYRDGTAILSRISS